MKYRILEGPSQHELARKIYELNKEGWRPVGQPAHTLRGWWQLIRRRA